MIAWRGKGGLHHKGGFQERNGGQARRASLGEVEVLGGEKMQKLSRTIYKVLVSLHVWSNLKWERRLKDERPAHKMKE